MKETIFKALVIILMFCLIAFGMFYILSEEEKGYPRYEIRQDRELFRTDSYSIDSLSCLHFNEFNKKLNGTRKRPITICGGKYIITDRNQVK